MMLSYRRLALFYESISQFDQARHYHGKAFDVLQNPVKITETVVSVNITSRMCLISNLLEVAEKGYLSNEDKIICYEKAIGKLKEIAVEREFQWGFTAPLIIRDLEKKIQKLKE